MQQYGELVEAILRKRGFTSHDEAAIFLNPNYERDLYDPFLMRDMDRVCVHIFDAINKNKKIVIYADYDCDGIPGAVILKDFFDLVQYSNYEVYIPKRNSEGYGLNIEAIETFKEKKIDLIITIDLGITAVEEVALANKYNIEVIITDHHIPQQVLPKAYAILNPKVDDYPEKMLCGAGVVFKFVSAFLKKYGEKFNIKAGAEKWFLDMAGLATLSDMVPLTGENRAIAYFGIMVLRKSRRPGFQKLLKKMSIDQKYLAEDDIGFMVTPRLNAASRMDDPLRAYELLSTTDEVEGGMLADHLSKINDERKSIVLGIMKHVKKTFESREVKDVVVIGSPEWKIGVLGLVAGKITDEYKMTAFVWGKDENDLIKGSCRSDGRVSVVELMTETADSFTGFGGHELAGGFTVHSEKIHFLEEELSKSFNKVKRVKEENELTFDVQTDFSMVTMKNWRDLEKMAPFGIDNPKPVFLFSNVKIEHIKKFGKNGSGEHLETTFSDTSKHTAKAIAFFCGVDSFKVPLVQGLNVNLLATFDLSRFRGREELRLRIVDIL